MIVDLFDWIGAHWWWFLKELAVWSVLLLALVGWGLMIAMFVNCKDQGSPRR